MKRLFLTMFVGISACATDPRVERIPATIPDQLTDPCPVPAVRGDLWRDVAVAARERETELMICNAKLSGIREIADSWNSQEEGPK